MSLYGLGKSGRSFEDRAVNPNKTTNFGMLDAWQVVLDLAASNDMVYACVISLKRVGDHYEIDMVAVNDRYEMIVYREGRVVGRKIEAFNVTKDFLRFLDGRQSGTLSLSYLLNTPHEN